MEAAEPIQIETPMTCIDNEKINFIEELIIKKEAKEYNIKFGTKENDLVIKVIPQDSKDIVYYQQYFTMNELKNISMIFAIYQSIGDLIKFLKKLQFDIDEKDEELILKFNIFMPDGQNKLIELSLNQCLPNSNHLIKYLLKEIQSIKIIMKNEQIKNDSEIKILKENDSHHETEINKLKEIINNNNIEILNLKEENIKLKEEINKLKLYHEKSNANEISESLIFDSKIIQSLNSIDFILNYIRQNDKSFSFNNIKLLYTGSRDGDSTKTCHKLCDDKQNILIIMKSDTGYIFGGYSKIGFKTINERSKREYKIDNNCFLFSINLNKIYPVIKDVTIICHISDKMGLCFASSLGFEDNFLQIERKIGSFIMTKFNGFKDKYEINGDKNTFRIVELEVFQLL